MERFYKYYIATGVFICLLIAVLYLVPMFIGRPIFGGQGQTWITNSVTLVGASTNFGDKIASSTAFADSVTAVSGYKAGVTQVLQTSEIDNVILNIMAKGGTVTSTLHIRQMGSEDGTNYFDISSSTSKSVTSTLTNNPTALNYAPGTATSSMSVAFETYGYKYIRFIIWGDDVILDPNDGTYAWITAVKPTPTYQ